MNSQSICFWSFEFVKCLFHPYRKIDPKDPSPSGVVDKSTSDIGTHGHAHKVHNDYECHVIASFPERHEVGNNHVDDHVDATAAHTLNGSSSNQHCSITSATSDAAAQSEEGDNGHGDPSPPED